MSLYASFSEDANGVFSTVAGKIKDSGDDLWSPIYGAGGRDLHPRFASGKSGIGLSMTLASLRLPVVRTSLETAYDQ